MTRHITALAALVLAGTAASPALAQDIKLPPSMAFTAYDTGTSGFNIAVGVGKMMKDKYGSDIRVLPAGNDVARLAPLRTNRAVLAWMGTGSYFAQEGVFEFGVKEWGPQALQMTLSTVDCNGLSVGVTKDAGVKEWKDFKGKRLGFVVGSPALNQNALAIIAYGGLTQKDVKIVEFASYGAMWKGLLNNDADGAFGLDRDRPRQGSRNLAARSGLAGASARRQGGMGAGQEGRRVLQSACGDLWRRHQRLRASETRCISVSDRNNLRDAVCRSGLCADQGDDHRLRRL